MSSDLPDIDAPKAAPSTSRKSIIGPIVLSIAFVMELTLVPLLLPSIQRQYDLSIVELAWVFNSYGISVAIGVLLGGWFGDAFSAKRVFSIGVLMFALGSIMVALSNSFESLVIGRAIQGFGGGIFSPLIPLLLTRASPQRPGKVLIVWGSVAGYVAALAPIIYSNFTDGFSWRLAFVFFAFVSISAWAIIPGARAEEPLPSPIKSTIRLSRFAQAGDLWFMFGYVFCTYGSISYYLFRLPVRMDLNEWKVASIGLILSLMWSSFSILSTILRNRVDQPNVRSIMLIAPVLIAAGFSLSYFCEDLICLVISAVLVGCGLACSNAPSTQLILKLAPSGMSAVSASLDITFARLGGVAMVAVLSQAEFGFTVVAVVAMCAAAIGCAIVATKSLIAKNV